LFCLLSLSVCLKCNVLDHVQEIIKLIGICRGGGARLTLSWEQQHGFFHYPCKI
jgi:hypothetical protein